MIDKILGLTILILTIVTVLLLMASGIMLVVDMQHFNSGLQSIGIACLLLWILMTAREDKTATKAVISNKDNDDTLP